MRAISSKVYGLSVPELEAESGYSRPTVYRDLRVLRDAGFPLTVEKRQGVARYRLLRQAELPQVGPNALQITALHLARAALEPLSGTGFVAELDALLAKLRPPELQQTLHFPKDSRGYPGRPDVLRVVERALHSRRRVALEYHAASRHGTLSVVRVEPLLLSVADREPYLRAYCVEREAERTYKIARIAKAELTSEPFTYRPSHPPARAYEHSVKIWAGDDSNLTTVKIRLDRHVAWLAREYPLVPNQDVANEKGGSCIVTARVAGIVEATRWVLSWGGSAEVLAPDDLREATRQELASALGKYDGPRPGPAKAKRRKSTARDARRLTQAETG